VDRQESKALMSSMGWNTLAMMGVSHGECVA
jgi:hypothetical protein